MCPRVTSSYNILFLSQRDKEEKSRVDRSLCVLREEWVQDSPTQIEESHLGFTEGVWKEITFFWILLQL